MILVAVIAFIVMLLALVLAHEAGHFFAAKWSGCNVEEFGFGFPPRLFSFIRKGTRYSFNLLPLGGFVKIEGENMDEAEPTPTSFAAKSAGKRVFILSAGVIMNMVLAYVLLTVQAGVGAPTLVTDTNTSALTSQKTYILDVAKDSPAEKAGFKEFDRIVEMQGIKDPSIDQVQQIVSQYAGQEVNVEVDRAGQKIKAYVLVRENPPEGEGATGVSLASTGLIKAPWWKAPWVGLTRTWDMLVAILVQFWALIGQLFQHGNAGDTLTGPIGIAVYTNEATQLGLPYFLEFMALISINLAIINILPLPALDGGRILFVGLEKIFGRRSLGKIEHYTHTAGFVALIALMVFITLHDVHKYF